MMDEATVHLAPGVGRDHAPCDFLSDQQLADMLGVTTRTTLRWRRDGGGPPYVRLGPRYIRYRSVDVDAWARARTFASLAAEAVA